MIPSAVVASISARGRLSKGNVYLCHHELINFGTYCEDGDTRSEDDGRESAGRHR